MTVFFLCRSACFSIKALKPELYALTRSSVVSPIDEGIIRDRISLMHSEGNHEACSYDRIVSMEEAILLAFIQQLSKQAPYLTKLRELFGA